MDSLKGQLLISGGGLYDPNFRHTVVLIGAHDAGGAVGVILNRPMDVTVHQAISALAELTGPDEALFEGGPVAADQAVLVVEATNPGVPDLLVFGAVGFLTGEVSADVRSAVLRARVFLGHAGWGPGQLESELETGSWIIDPARADDVFTADPRGLWRHVLERKGHPFAQVARVPFDPRAN